MIKIAKISIALMVMLVIVVWGMSATSKENSDKEEPKNANELGISYMEEKYGEHFVFHAPAGDSMTGTRQFFVTSDSMPNQQIMVEIENFRTDNKIFRDNYLSIKYQDETIEFLRSNVSDYYSNFNIYYEASSACQSAGLSANASFEEYLSDNRAELNVMIELKASEFIGTESLKNIVDKITDFCNNMTLTVIVVDDNIFGTLGRKGLNNRIAHRDYVAMAKVYIDQDGVEINWKGNVATNN